MFFFNSNFIIFQKQKVGVVRIVCRLFVAISMSKLLAILFFLLSHNSSYSMTFKRIKMKISCVFFCIDFQLNFSNIILKASILNSTKVLSEEDSKSITMFYRVQKRYFFFTSNTIILQSIWSTF
jgi:hypothetical protein